MSSESSAKILGTSRGKGEQDASTSLLLAQRAGWLETQRLRAARAGG